MTAAFKIKEHIQSPKISDLLASHYSFNFHHMCTCFNLLFIQYEQHEFCLLDSLFLFSHYLSYCVRIVHLDTKVGCNLIWISPTVQWSREDWCSPVGKLHYLWGFILFFFAPFGFWWSCCPRVNSSFAAPSSMNHFMSQLGFHFGVADQWMRKKAVVQLGLCFSF